MSVLLLQELKDLPPFNVSSLPGVEVDVSLLIPARNAAESLEGTVKAARHHLERCFGESYEIILIPNPAPGNTQDRSTEMAERLAAQYPRVRVVPHSIPPGKGAALRTGFLQSRGKWIFFTDSDLPYELDFFDRARARLEQGYDLVTGNRRLGSSHFQVPVGLLHLAYARHRLGLAFNRVVRWLLPIRSTDTQAGIKAMSRRLAAAAFSRQVCPGFFFDLEFFLTAAGHGFVQTDMTVTLHLNTEKSTVRVMRESVLAAFWLLRIFLRHRAGAYQADGFRPVRGRELLARYPKTSWGTRFFLTARWYLTPYLDMVALLPPKGAALDLGCGHGLLALAIALGRRELQVLGFDHDVERVKLAQTAAQGLSNLRFRIGGMEFPEGRYAGITMIDVMHYFPRVQQERLLRQAFDRLAPGGRLLVREVEPENGPMSAFNRLYERIATATGFTRSQESELYFRTTAEWEELLRGIGFTVRSGRCSSLIFSDVLFVAERPESPAPASRGPR